MVERFQLSIYIFFVVLQYMKVRARARARARVRVRSPQLSPEPHTPLCLPLPIPLKVGGGGLGSEGLKDLLGSILFIYGSELVVDWIKHAFVVKFNHISPTVCSRLTNPYPKEPLLLTLTLTPNPNPYR